MAQIYKAYDIRGIYPEELNEEIIFKIGKAYADILIDELKKDEVTIVVGQDMRVSSPMLTKSLIRESLGKGPMYLILVYPAHQHFIME